MVSWCSSSVSTEVEFNISKQLFIQYASSKDVINKLDISYSKIVLNFFRLYVGPVLSNLVFYKRKQIRHFDYYSNFKLESTVRGIKHGCTPVTPATSLDNSVALISSMDKRKNGSINLSTSYYLTQQEYMDHFIMW